MSRKKKGRNRKTNRIPGIRTVKINIFSFTKKSAPVCISDPGTLFMFSF